MIGLGIGIPFNRYTASDGGIDPQAQAHYDRVIADGGVLTYGLIGVDTIVKQLKYIYNITDIATLNIDSKWLDYFGYKAGSGSGLTAGRAIQKAYSILGSNFDYIQNTTTAQPALAAWNGTNYLLSFNLTNAGFQTPDNVNNQLLNDFCIETRCNLGSTGNQGICSKLQSTTNANFAFYKNSNNLVLVTSKGGVNYTYTSTAKTTDQYLRVSRNATTGIIKFFSSSDGVTWSQVGTDISGITGAVTNSGGTFWVGFSSFYAGATGELYYLKVFKDDSFTTATQNFDASRYNRSVSQTTITSLTGETWTFTPGTAATGLKSMIVDQTMIQGNGTSMGMQAASASINSLVFTQYNTWRKFSNLATTYGILNEYSADVASVAGMAFTINDPANTEQVYTNSNVGLSGTSWQSTNTSLKVSTFKGNILGSPYEQGLLTNNVANTFNAIQAVGNNTTEIVATGKNLLARNNATSLWINAVWVGDLMTTQTDTSGQEAAIYNMFAEGTNII